MARLEVIGDTDDDVAAGDVDHVGRQRLGAERGLDRFGRGAVRRGLAEVDVRRADHVACQLLRQVVLLVRVERRSEHGEGVRAVLLDDSLDLAGGVRDQFAPVRRGLRRARRPAPHQVLLQALLVGDGVVVEAAAHADLVGAHRIDAVRLDDDGAAAARADADRAADGAGVARRARPVLRACDPLVGLLHQGSRGADVDTGAAEVAVRLIDAAAGAKRDARGVAPIRERDGAGVADLITGADAARADDAHLRVELEPRVGAVRVRLLRLVVRAILERPRLDVLEAHVEQLVRRLQLAAIVLRAGEAAVGDDVVAQADVARHAFHAAVAGEAAVAVVGVDDRQHLLPRFLDRLCFGVDDHAIGDARRTRELQAARARDLDEAGATAGIRRETVDVAEVGDPDAVLLDDFDERRALGRFDLDAVQCEPSHASSPPPRARPLTSAPGAASRRWRSAR